MANEFIQDIVESARGNLASDEAWRLEETLVELEAKCNRFFSDQDKDDSLNLLSVRLVKEAIRIENVQLCLLAMKNLDVHNLITLLNLDSTPPRETLKFVSNYFQIGTHGQGQEHNKSENSVELDKQDDTLFGTNTKETGKQDSTKYLTTLEEAQDNETEENFGEALSLYELSGTQHANLLRVSMKHLMCASHDVLQKYCLDRFDLRPIWFDYLLECKLYEDAVSFCESIGDELTGLLVKFSKQPKGKKMLELLPDGVREFALAGPDKWTSVRQLDSVSSMGTTGLNDKSLIAELTAYFLRHDNVNLALSLIFSLNRANFILDQYLAQSSDYQINLSLVTNHGQSYFKNSHLLHYLINRTCHNLEPNCDIIRSACNDLGLLDELIQMMHGKRNSIDYTLNHLLERLERIVENGSPEKLDTIDPLLGKSTLKSVLRFMKQEDDRDLSVKYITVMILAINIFVMKIDPNSQTSTLDQAISNLEFMFACLVDHMDELTFNASDGLIRAANNLVIAIKSKLDALADSEIIRDSFMKIVDKVAGLCLIDARYKSAAILYSQIEDNVNAVKALMRTGEADTVMNYAMLVRDITVNRITINYIKHLRLEPEVIEDFIRRSKL